MRNLDKPPQNILIAIFRSCRLALHFLYGMALASFYPYMNHAKQRRILKSWSRQLLNILNIGIQTEGQQFTRSEIGLLIIANHVSWLDVFVLNAIHPSHFVANAEVRSWPLIGWLCKRCGTIFVERAMRRDAASVTRRVSRLLEQGVCIGLFPEGATTDGKQVGHFHSTLIQPAIDAGARLCPVALRYLDSHAEPSSATAFTGNTTFAQSVWRILRCRHHNVLAIFTPALITANENRRMLSRTAQEVIAQELQAIDATRRNTAEQEALTSPRTMLSSQSAYALLLSPNLADD